MSFDERTFILALLQREEDAKTFSRTFNPEWLLDATLQPMMGFIRDFLRKYEVAPTLPALEQYVSDKEPEAFKLRYSPTFEKLKAAEKPDLATMVYTSRKAREYAVCRSFDSLIMTSRTMQQDSDGDLLLKEVHRWLQSFHGMDEDLTMDFREATNYLLAQYGAKRTLEPIKTGIKPLDMWTGDKGLWPKNLGIVVAPTGHGKSVILMNIAANMASESHKKVWFFTNELDMEEQTTRFLSFLEQHPVSDIQNSPLHVLKSSGLKARWEEEGLDQRLILTSANREVSTDDIESELLELINIQGFIPDVLVVDFMERMKPCSSGLSKDKEWNWIGGIAKDLVRLARKYKMVIWTAAQTNREGLRAEVLDNSMVQSSIKHLQEAACVVGMVQRDGDPGMSPDEESERVMRFFSMKQRHSSTSATSIEMKVDLAKMTVTDETYERKVDSVHSEPEVDDSGQGKPLKKWNKKKGKGKTNAGRPGYDKYGNRLSK